MADGTQRTRTWRIIPLFLLLVAMLVGGGIALAGVPAGVPAGIGAAPPSQGKSGLPQQQQGKPSVSGPAQPGRLAVGPPAAPLVTLYDQLNNAGTVSTNSQEFETANAAFNNQAADDFVVPSGQSWQVTEVDAQGVYFNGPGPAASFNVYFYTSVTSGTYTIPGTAVYTATGQTYVNTAGVFAITLGSPPTLAGPGT